MRVKDVGCRVYLSDTVELRVRDYMLIETSTGGVVHRTGPKGYGLTLEDLHAILQEFEK